MSDRISRRWVEYITDFVNAGPLLDQSDGNSSGKEGSKLAPRQKPPSSPGDVAPSLYSDGPSGIKQAEDAFIYREEMHQLALELAETLATTRTCLERQRKETDQIAAQITDIQGQLKEIQEQNSARDSCLKQVWDHVRKLNQWAAEAREIINRKSLPSPGQCGSLDM